MRNFIGILILSLCIVLSSCDGGSSGAASSSGSGSGRSSGTSNSNVLVSGLFSDSQLSAMTYTTDDVAYMKIRKGLQPFMNLFFSTSIAADASYQCYSNQTISFDITVNGYNTTKTVNCNNVSSINSALRVALIPAISGETLKKSVSIDAYTQLDTELNYTGGLNYNVNYFSVYKLGARALPCYEAIKLQSNGTGQIVKGDIPTAHELGDGSHCPVAVAHVITYRYRDGGIDIDLSGQSNYDSISNAANFERWEIQ